MISLTWSIILGAISLITSLLNIFLTIKIKSTSNFSFILKIICLLEACYLYSQAILILNLSDSIFTRIQSLVIFNIISSTSLSIIGLKLKKVIYYTSYNLYLLLNIYSCYDLLKFLSNPISSNKKRVKIMLCISIGSSITIGLIVLILSDGENSLETMTDRLLEFYYIAIYFIIMLLVNIIMAFISLASLVSRFCKSEFSFSRKEARNSYILRTTASYFFFFVLTVPFNLTMVLDIIYVKILGDSPVDEIYVLVMFLVSQISSLVLIFLRMKEISLFNFFGSESKNLKRSSSDEKTYNSSLNNDSMDNLDRQNNVTKNSIYTSKLLMKNPCDETSIEGLDSDKKPKEDVNITLANYINTSMNFEFISCILYGLSDVFTDQNNKQIRMEEAQLSLDFSDKRKLLKDSKVHTIFYSVIDSNVMVCTQIEESLSNENYISKIKEQKESLAAKSLEKVSSNTKSLISLSKRSNRKPNLSNKSKDTNNEKTERLMNSESQIEHIPVSLPLNQKKSDAVIIEHYPRLFQILRKIDNLTGDLVVKAFDPYLNRTNMSKIKPSEGKSGSFFFFTHDNRFLIKTITEGELETIKDNFILDYFNYMQDHSDHTLITKIYGVYTVVIQNVSQIHVILMQNLMIFPLKNVRRLFDLKGSQVDRFTKHIENCSKTTALKDQDFLWMKKALKLVDFSKDAIEDILYTLEDDLTLLRNLNLMDYSLLLIILEFPKEEEEDYQDIINVFGDSRYCRKVFKSRKSKFIYCMGIIDYLQKFNLSKFLENKYKTLIYGKQIKFVSAVDPTIYAERMIEFLKRELLVSNKEVL